MLSLKLKFPKNLNIFDKLKEYTGNKCNEEVIRFFTDIQQNRNVICKMSQLSVTSDLIQSNIPVVISYINQLVILKSKVTFGKKKPACSISFEWYDTIKNSKYSSHNIYFEYFSCLFLLAMMYYQLAINLINENKPLTNKDIIKEIGQQLRTAKSLIDLIKNESGNLLPISDSSPDLSLVYLEYLSSYMGAYVQIYTLKFLEFAKNYSLQSKIAMGASKCFETCVQCASNQSMPKSIDKEFKTYLIFQKEFYCAEAFFKKRSEKQEAFDSTGTGFNAIVKHQEVGAELLLQIIEKYGKQCAKYLNLNELVARAEEEGNRWKQWNDDNTRLYHEPEITEFDYNLESKIIDQEKLPDDLKLNLSNEVSSSLDVLVAGDVSQMISTFKHRMMDDICSQLDKQETEKTINDYINSLTLPPSILGINNNQTIDQNLWNEITKCKQTGGTNGMFAITKQIENLSLEMETKLKFLYGLLSNEMANDKKQREIYKERWSLKISSEANANLMNSLKHYYNIITQTRQYDTKAKQYITDNGKNFDMLDLSREQLNDKLNQNNSKPKPLSKEEEIVKNSLNNLTKTRSSIQNQINNIFNEFNNDSKYPPMFVEVLNAKTTENAIFENQKQQFIPMFQVISDLSEKVRKEKQIINDTLPKVNANNPSNNNNNNTSMLSEISTIVIQYQKHYGKLIKGLNYYKQIQNEINNLENNIKNFISQRNIESKNLLVVLNHASMNTMNQQQYRPQMQGNQWNNMQNPW